MELRNIQWDGYTKTKPETWTNSDYKHALWNWNNDEMKKGKPNYFTIPQFWDHQKRLQEFMSWLASWEGGQGDKESGGEVKEFGQNRLGVGEIDVGRLWKSSQGNIDKYDL